MDPEETSVYLDYYDATSPSPGLQEARPRVPYGSVLLPVFYAAVFLAGLLGNLVLVAALHCRPGGRRLIDVFITNLAASDFLFLLTLPLWVDKEASSGRWRAGAFLCKGSSYAIAVNMHCSVLLLACMSADRCLAVVRPAASRRLRRRDAARALCAGVWLASCLLGLPTLLSRELAPIGDQPYCAEQRATPGRLTWSLVALILTFFVPLLSIVTCYCCIARRLCAHYRQSGKHNKKLKKSIKVIFIVVAAFLVSWLPFSTFKLLAIVSGLRRGIYSPSAVLQFGMEVTGPLAFANSCVNPFIYYTFDSYIRRAVVRCWCPCLKLRDLGSSAETSDSRLSKALSAFLHAEDFTRRRKRSVSL
ncbi:G-protein coupled receptor 15 [Saimiri boliviensis]|uniref:G-protein coupled receptor 15 n=1 Tax=Saimiri boliviensis TaxID=27679 RepID=UPI00027FC40D|nr:G-protein coupled receptor 15 [Saimiri boliviensis boliviensis]